MHASERCNICLKSVYSWKEGGSVSSGRSAVSRSRPGALSRTLNNQDDKRRANDVYPSDTMSVYTFVCERLNRPSSSLSNICYTELRIYPYIRPFPTCERAPTLRRVHSDTVRCVALRLVMWRPKCVQYLLTQCIYTPANINDSFSCDPIHMY